MKRAVLCGVCLLLVWGYAAADDGVGNTVYKDRMREFVQAISGYAKTAPHPGFIIIPQNGLELVMADADNAGPPHTAYLAAIDGVGQEDLFYGYDNDDQPTAAADTNYLTDFLDIAEANGVQALVTDYCSAQANMDDSYAKNNVKEYISFAADHRGLDDIPDYPAAPYGENSNDITTLAQAQNFLYLIDPSAYTSKTEFIDAVAATNYDIVLIDLFYDGTTELTSTDVTHLKTKHNGGSRLVISYMSIGEAENYRYYWDPAWNTNTPSWLKGENPDWPGNYKVEYWDPEWQAVIFGSPSAYLSKILAAGFDGVYLDIIDAFEYFE